MRILKAAFAVAATALSVVAVPGIAAAQGPVVAPGAQAAALVHANGTIVRSKGIEAVFRPAVGTYCISLDPSIDPAVTVASATPSNEAGFDADLTVVIPASLIPDCTPVDPDDTDIAVIAHRGNARADVGFYLVVP